jgi:hypothetical protein
LKRFKMPESNSLQGQQADARNPLEGRPEIVIDKEGNWFYNGLPIINRKIQLYFCQLLEIGPDGGYLLRNEQEVCPVEVQDTPFVVTSLWPSDGPHEQFFIKLNDDTVETLDMQTLVISAENIPYCQVKQGRFRARFLRAPYYRLAESVQQEGDAKFFIELNGERHYLLSA